eukprot:758035_1
MAAATKSNNDTQETAPLMSKSNPSLTIAAAETNTMQNDEQPQTGTKSEEIETFEETKHETEDIRVEMTRKANDETKHNKIPVEPEDAHGPIRCCCIECPCGVIETRLVPFHKRERDSTMMLIDLNVKGTDYQDLLLMLMTDDDGKLETTDNDDDFLRKFKQKVMQIRKNRDAKWAQENEGTFKEEIERKLNQMRENDVADMMGLIMSAMKKMTSRGDETWTHDDDEDVLQLWISKKLREIPIAKEDFAKMMVWMVNKTQKPVQNGDDNREMNAHAKLLSKIKAANVTDPKVEGAETKKVNKYGDSVPRKLTEDIWALQYCVVKNRKVLPCSLCFTISCILW